MTRWFNRNASFVLVIGFITLYVLSVLINLGHFNLQGEEPRRAIISIEMLESGDFIVPHSLGWEYYNKPPLFNWILAGFIYLSGSASEFILRLPSLLFFLVWAACHYLVCRKYFSKKLALLSTFFMVTVPEIFFYGLANGAEIDVFYSFIVYLQAICIFWFYQQQKWGSLFMLSWLCCAIGFLTKGFPSLIFQGMTIVALCVYAKSVRIIFKPQHLAGIGLFLLITGLYFYAYSTRGSLPVLLVNLLNESLGKMSSSGKSSTGSIYSFLIYPFTFMKLLSPWSFLLLLLFAKPRFKLWDNPLVRFSLLFIVFNIMVYWLAGTSKLRYVYIFVPFAMNIFVAIYAQFVKEKPVAMDKYLRFAGAVFFLVLGGLLALPFIYSMDASPVILLAGILLLFLLAFYRAGQYRIWLFITGLVLTRFIYASIAIPLQKRGMFDYKQQMEAMIIRNNKQEMIYGLPPDTLHMDIVVGDTLFKWTQKPVLVPPFLYHQFPYYFYRSTGSIMKYDTSFSKNKTYISYQKNLERTHVEPIFSFYDKRSRDSLVMFRLLSTN